MKIYTAIIIIALLSLTACKKSEDVKDSKVVTTTINEKALTNDRKTIEDLVRDMYIWNEKRDYKHEFEPVIKNGKAVGYNLDSHKIFLKELLDSGFFSQEFIANIDKVFQEQNKLLTNGKVQWREGEMGPFQGDANVWCGCQDEPAEDAYNKLTLHFENLDNNSAKFYWNWEGYGDDWAAKQYYMRAVKEDGKWKIAYMQGWDYNANLGVE